jgi:hypothetical protein
MTTSFRAVARLLLLMLGFAGLLAAMTWPVGAHPASTLLGSPGSDAYQYLWNTWHFQYALSQGHSPMSTGLQLYPAKLSLWLHAYTSQIGLLHTLLPGRPALAINVALALHFGLGGAGGAWLARRMGLGWGAALAVGVWYAFTSFKTTRLAEHTNLLLNGLVPFYIGCFLLAFAFEPGQWRLRVRRWRAVVGCGALGLLTALGDYPTTFWLLYFSGAVWLFYGFGIGRINWRTRKPWLWLGVGLVVAHLLVRLLQRVGPDDNGGLWWGGDLVGYLMPPPQLWWSGALSRAVYQNPRFFHMPGSVENVMFLGYAIPLLALVLLWWRRRRDTQPLLSAAPVWTSAGPALWFVVLVFLLITLPEGRIFGHKTLRPPTALLHFVPFFNNLRCPTRAVIIPALLLPLLTLRALLSRVGAEQRPVLGWAILAVALLEIWPRPYPVTALPATDPSAAIIAQLPTTGPLLSIPLGIRDGMHEIGQFQMTDLLEQTYHHRPVLSGYLSRLPKEQFAAFAADPVLMSVVAIQADSAASLPPLTPGQVAAFEQQYQPAGVRLHPGYQSAALRGLVLTLTAGKSFQTQRLPDGSLLFYRTEESAQSPDLN